MSKSFRLIKRELLKLNRDHLRNITELPGIPGEREMEKPRLKWLTSLLVTGDFNRADWAYCLCKENGKTYRVNGQHTTYLLNKVITQEIQANFPEGIPLVLERWECEELADLPDVFDQFDNHRSARKPKDKLGVFQAQHGDVRTVGKKLTGMILTGIDWGVSRNEVIAEVVQPHHRPTSAYERGILLNEPEVREFVLFVADRQDGPFMKYCLQRTGLVAWFFEAFLSKSRDKFRILFETFCYEATKASSEFADWVRRQAKATGKDAGVYYRELANFVRKVERELKSLSDDEIEEMLNRAKTPEEVPSA